MFKTICSESLSCLNTFSLQMIMLIVYKFSCQMALGAQCRAREGCQIELFILRSFCLAMIYNVLLQSPITSCHTNIHQLNSDFYNLSCGNNIRKNCLLSRQVSVSKYSIHHFQLTKCKSRSFIHIFPDRYQYF